MSRNLNEQKALGGERDSLTDSVVVQVRDELSDSV